MFKSTGLVFAEKPSIGIEPTNLPDRSRFGNHGTHTNVTMVRLPSGLWVRQFDGDGYVSLTIPAVIGTGDFSIALWFKPTSESPTNTLISFSDNSPTIYQRYANTNTLLYYSEEGEGGVIAETLSDVEWTVNTWVHAVVYRSSGDIYLVKDAVASALSIADNATDIGAVAVNLGRRILDNDRFLNGYIALPKILCYAPSIGQIKKTREAEHHWFGV